MWLCPFPADGLAVNEPGLAAEKPDVYSFDKYFTPESHRERNMTFRSLDLRSSGICAAQRNTFM
jgi:hypothetical protein